MKKRTPQEISDFFEVNVQPEGVPYPDRLLISEMHLLISAEFLDMRGCQAGDVFRPQKDCTNCEGEGIISESEIDGYSLSGVVNCPICNGTGRVDV